jgi:hypothetical protein
MPAAAPAGPRSGWLAAAAPDGHGPDRLWVAAPAGPRSGWLAAAGPAAGPAAAPAGPSSS